MNERFLSKLLKSKNNYDFFNVTLHRPDIFQMKVGNLSPGATCEITISFIMELPVEEGKTRMTIPTTIAPRYIADKHHAR